MQTDYGSSSLSQWAVAEWLASGLYEKHMENIRTQLKHRRAITLALLEKHFKGIATWSVPRGGFYLWVRILPAISSQALFEKALSEGILLNPGHLYDRHSTQYLRISYSYASLAEIEAGLVRVAELIRQMMGKQ